MDKKRKIIYRVDDRFIHGQVIEGWINYFRIPNVILVNDVIASDDFKKFIYESIVPSWSHLTVISIKKFEKFNLSRIKGDIIVILGSIEDLWKILDKIVSEDYVNIGCLACGHREIEITDTVFIDRSICNALRDILFIHDVFVHKLPWEVPVNLKNIFDDLCGKL